VLTGTINESDSAYCSEDQTRGTTVFATPPILLNHATVKTRGNAWNIYYCKGLYTNISEGDWLDKLTERQTDRLTDWLTDWLTD